MAAADAGLAARLQRAGLEMVTPRMGLAALGALTSCCCKQSTCRICAHVVLTQPVRQSFRTGGLTSPQAARLVCKCTCRAHEYMRV